MNKDKEVQTNPDAKAVINEQKSTDFCFFTQLPLELNDRIFDFLDLRKDFQLYMLKSANKLFLARLLFSLFPDQKQALINSVTSMAKDLLDQEVKPYNNNTTLC